MLKKIFLLLFTIVILAYCATDIGKIIKNVQKKYKKVSSIYVDFKQINRFKLTGLSSEIFGSLLLTKDDRFRLETEDQIIVSDGKTFWRYNKLENQVIIDYAKKTEQDVFLHDFLFNIQEKYFSQVLSERKVNSDKIFEIKLTPKNSESSFFEYIKVWIVDKSWEIKRVIYVDYNENETEYEIEKLSINPTIKENDFKLNIPQGIEVVDLRF